MTPRLKRALTAALVAIFSLLAAVGFGGSVATAAQGNAVTIRQIDTTDWPTVRMSVLISGGRVDARSINVRDGNDLVGNLSVVPLGKSATPVGTVLTIDVSGSMAALGRIEAAKAAADAFIDRMLPGEKVAIVTFNDEPHMVSNFTADRGVLHSAIAGLQAHGETALWDGIRMATGLLQGAPDLQPNVVVLSDGSDTSSESTAAEAQAALIAAKAVTFTVGLGSTDAAALQSVATATGGAFFPAASADALRNVYASVQDALQAQYELSYKAQGSEPRQVTVSVAGSQASGLASPGTLARGLNTNPDVVKTPQTPGLLSGTAGKLLITLMVLAAAGAIAWVVIMVSTRPASQLDERLQPYATDNTDTLMERAGVVHAETQLAKRAVDPVNKSEVGREVLSWLETQLDRANLPVRALEAIFFYGIA
jgi:uncharacterized protein YegL